MIERIDLFKAEISSLDQNYNGGKISNYRYYLNFPIQFFNEIPQNKIIDKPYVYKKLFIRNKTENNIHDIIFYLLPSKFGFETYNENYQFYLTKSVNENDIEKDIDIENSYGIINFYKNVNYNFKVIYLEYPKRQNNIRLIENLNNTPIIIYKKSTNEIMEENLIIKSQKFYINDELFYRCEVKYPLKYSYSIYEHKVSLGLYHNLIEKDKYYPIWIGFEFYDFINNYIFETQLIITYNKEIINLEVV